MASFHIRSNSFPSQSHPLVDDVENQLYRLKSSAEVTSSSAICSNLASLKDLHKSIYNMIQMPSTQQALSNEELLEGSLRLVDLCEISREIVCSEKGSVQQLESSIRRNKLETATAEDINAYVASKKKINKMVNKCIKNLKDSNVKVNNDLNAIETMLKETEAIGFSVLKICNDGRLGGKGKTKAKALVIACKIHSKQPCALRDKCELGAVEEKEMSIQEIEEGLETLFRSLVKTRVSLLNVLSH